MIKHRLVSLFGIVVLLAPVALGARHKDKKQRLIGRVIAKDAYLGLARLNSPASVEVFIVRVDAVAREQTSLRFIKVRYEDYEAKKGLPPDLYDGKVLWRFSLSRDKSCDQTVSERLFVIPNNSSILPEGGSYILLENTGPDLPKVQSLLPCFVVQPGGIKRLSSTSAN